MEDKSSFPGNAHLSCRILDGVLKSPYEELCLKDQNYTMEAQIPTDSSCELIFWLQMTLLS